MFIHDTIEDMQISEPTFEGGFEDNNPNEEEEWRRVKEVIGPKRDFPYIDLSRRWRPPTATALPRASEMFSVPIK